MELECLLIDLYNEYKLYYSGNILQFIEGKEFKIPGFMILAISGFMYELERENSLIRSIHYYNSILTEEEKETLISALKSERDSND